MLHLETRGFGSNIGPRIEAIGPLQIYLDMLVKSRTERKVKFSYKLNTVMSITALIGDSLE
jgi:hypothetical protein